MAAISWRFLRLRLNKLYPFILFSRCISTIRSQVYKARGKYTNGICFRNQLGTYYTTFPLSQPFMHCLECLLGNVPLLLCLSRSIMDCFVCLWCRTPSFLNFLYFREYNTTWSCCRSLLQARVWYRCIAACGASLRLVQSCSRGSFLNVPF
jgi:hypothetical protein